MLEWRKVMFQVATIELSPDVIIPEQEGREKFALMKVPAKLKIEYVETKNIGLMNKPSIAFPSFYPFSL